MKIIPATPEHAPAIADAILMALGEETCRRFNTPSNPLYNTRELFRRCAASDDSQYSWRNTLVAVDDDDRVLGLVVSYDGARLDELRRRFLDEFDNMHGFRIDARMTQETTPDEWYIDSLAVWPWCRGRGTAKALIEAAAERGKATTGKPTGLLVDKTNHRARGLYNRMGFQPDGERRFAGELMDHMLLK